MKYWNTLTGPVRLRDCLNPDSDRVYDTLEDFVRNFHYLRIKDKLADVPVKKVDSNSRFYSYFARSLQRRYNLLDDCGLIIPLWKIDDASKQLGRPGVRVFYYDRDYPGFRRDPVARTHKRRGCSWFSTYYKTPHHKNEKTQTAGHMTDNDIKYYGVKIRGRRSVRSLPNPWDDYPRGDIRDRRNWKQNRKTQWQ